MSQEIVNGQSTRQNLIKQNLLKFRFQKENPNKMSVDEREDNEKESDIDKSQEKLTSSNLSSSSNETSPNIPKVYNKIIIVSSSSDEEDEICNKRDSQNINKKYNASSFKSKQKNISNEHLTKSNYENNLEETQETEDTNDKLNASSSSNQKVKDNDNDNDDLIKSSNHNEKNAMAILCNEKFSELINRKRNHEDDTTKPSNGTVVQTSKRPRKDLMQDIKDDNDEYDEEDEDFSRERVFDSDADSEDEYYIMNKNKKEVMEFLNNATADELLMMRCTQKRADAIISLRPYEDWKHLVTICKETRAIGSDILNITQDFLYSRQAVESLMKKCLKIAQQLEYAIKEGSNHIKKDPPNLCQTKSLTPYQLIGLNWLYIMHKQKLNAILADEMGLGKTIQVISFLAYLKHLGIRGPGPHLIVVPASTLDNWNNELESWCPSLKVIQYYGSPIERKMLRCKLVREGMNDIDVILTTYNTISGGQPEDRKMFRVFKMDYVIFDEAHWLKNMNTQRFDVLIRLNAQNRILLTGTPTQNNLVELMSLLIFLMPKIFGAKKEILQRLFSKMPKTLINNSSSKFESDQVERAKLIMKPFILRRLKREVLQELPKKTDETILVEMSESQKFFYNDLISKFTQEAKELNEDTTEEEKSSRVSMLMQLRKAANHTCLLRQYYTNDMINKIASLLAKDIFYKENNEEYIIEDLSILSDFQIFQLTKEYKSISTFVLPQELILDSGKFKHLDNLLLKLHSDGHRVLIFSQFVLILNILEEYLNINKWKFLRLDGSTPVQSRQDLIDEFNEDDSIFIFLLSTKAGGLGINLTAADTVIIHDIDFNPYNDKQAEDRCHRMGQTKPVTVLRLLSQGTVEEYMFQIAQEKLNLEKQLEGEGEDEAINTKNVISLLKKALCVGSPSKMNAH